MKWYRKWLGAVDLFHQFRAYIRLEIRNGNFVVMLRLIIKSTFVNVYCLYKITREFAL